MEQSQLLEMTDIDLQMYIKGADPTVFAASFEIDWGSSRGQGRRRGPMVLGAMSDISIRGVKKYSNLIAKLDLEGEDKLEVEGMPRLELIAYLQARAAGLDHNLSACFAYGGVDCLRAWHKNH